MLQFFALLMFVGLWSLPQAVAAPAGDLKSQHYDVVVERGVPAKMRDGVILRADVYRPKAEGSFPVLLQRTPYNKLWTTDTAYALAAHGYLVVVQDTRGRYTSDGVFYPFRDEANDGYDTVEWATALPQSNGKVGMFGASYNGVTQMEAAVAAPPHLAGIFPLVTASDYHDGWTYAGGAYEQWFNQTWAAGLIQDTVERRVVEGTRIYQDVTGLPISDYPRTRLGLPPTFGPATVGVYYKDWLEHPSYDDYWKAISIEQRYNKIRVPAYHVGGVYDIFLHGTLRNYQGIRAHAATADARNQQRLEIMMGAHNRAGPTVGDIYFGPDATFNEIDTILRWYDFLFKGIDNGLASEKLVKIFVMGRNTWRYEDDWPPAGSRTVQYFLHSAGHANSGSGDGELSATPPRKEKPDTFRYDPADSVRTVGGALCCIETDLPGGPFDQRPTELRKDILVYTTPVFRHEADLIGPVIVQLFASSSVVDTDFTAKLIDVWPGGYAQNLTDGILRARYRNSSEIPENMVPGQVYKLSIDLVSACDALLPGHRLRIEISSSNFPRFDRNLNTGADSLTTSPKMVVADNRVYHDVLHASAVVVTVAPTPAGPVEAAGAAEPPHVPPSRQKGP